MPNLLLEKIDYHHQTTRFGVWRRYLYPNGAYFAEFTSHRHLLGLPMFHYTNGICPETGGRIIAKGIIAIGRVAVGGIAVGHAAAGLIAIGKLGVGLIFDLGQASTGLLAVGQLAVGGLIGIGQFATGYVAIAQIGIGEYVLAQLGFGKYIWTPKYADPTAVEFFQTWKAYFFN